ncbi:TatD family hydrolase [Lentisphaerota bacterium ZTH]|nr:TatD family hydrolase [Lentisphaerota bacterium]WET07108.1 TatD family hydrolase [Lentisphaerota bacterium ZTH]
MKLFDTHFHFYGEQSPREYYDAIKIPELTYLLAVGGDLEGSTLARNFAEGIENSWFAAGIHPHSAAEEQAELSRFREFKDHEKLVAVGEIGLDYFYENSPRRCQRNIMEHFLQLALDWQLPAIIHCRDSDDKFDAYQDSHAMLRDFAADGGRFVVHCFSGIPHWAEKFMELGAFLGITGMVTFPRADNIRETLKVISDELLLIETDSPYLAPVPHRGKTNNPGYVIEVARKIAAERGCSIEQIADLTTSNAFRLFNLEQ